MSKVAILTNMMEFQPGYSLTGIVKDQIIMLKKYGHEVDLYVNDQYHGEDFGEDVNLKKLIPFTHLIDYKTRLDLTEEHKTIIDKTVDILEKELMDVQYVFTHDFVLTGWFMPYGMACVEVSEKLPDLKWMHWIHSIPTSKKDWWNYSLYGQNHKFIYPNDTDKMKVADAYNSDLTCVRVIPHIKDLRTWADFDSETCKFIDDYPGVMQSEIVQIYPASSDRFEAKRVREVISIFSKIKQTGRSVCLVIANQWATTQKQIDDTSRYKKIGEEYGLIPNKELIFTSEWQNGKYGIGLPKRILRELFMCSNLFIFPTKAESFGLVLPEAVLAGGVYCVLNKSLAMQAEISGHQSLYFDFGSYNCTHTIKDEDKYFKDIAWVILGRMQQNEAVMTKMFIRLKYNWDNLYNKFYKPIMMESEVW